MVNREAVLELAALVEKAVLPFDMGEAAVAPCGSACCIGGHAAWLWEEIRGDHEYNRETDELISYSWSENELALKLGVSAADQGELCFMYGVKDFGYAETTRRGAAATLRRLADTGVVEWRKEEQI